MRMQLSGRSWLEACHQRTARQEGSSCRLVVGSPEMESKRQMEWLPSLKLLNWRRVPEEHESDEDLALKQQLELYVERVQDADPAVQKFALESMRCLSDANHVKNWILND
ncbi:hypothetical protein COCNU_scaffold000040G000030 [Cocos nucifera]|nr:hypothetical protein [Cocos nucifera]